MPENQLYLPEGFRTPEPLSTGLLAAAAAEHRILEAPVVRCDKDGTLWVELEGSLGKIPREEAVSPRIAGGGREIAILSCVGRRVCFTVTGTEETGNGSPRWRLSRRSAQEQALNYLQAHLRPGAVIRCRVTRLERFGAFVDMGCGVISLIPLEKLSVARGDHSRERFRLGQSIRAVVEEINRETDRFSLSHRELLGTWLENAAAFREGETVPGIIRGIEPYGIFVELTPNLSGLAEYREGYQPGDGVAVQIRSIRPDRMKIKLWLVNPLPEKPPMPLRYQITDGVLERWAYGPPGCQAPGLVTEFAP